MSRTTNENVDILEYWHGHPYTVDAANLIKQCVWYVMGRVGERLGYPMAYWESMPNCSPNPAWTYVGVRHAKEWLKKTRWEVSYKPKVDSVIVLDGIYGHVAYVEADFGNGMYGISQYNKNSDKKFHYELVNLNGTHLYGMKILGYLVIPVKKVERDETKHQIKVVVDQLRIRKEHNTNGQFIRYASNGELFDVLEEYDDDTYKWCLTDSGWIATTKEWVVDYPIASEVELKTRISDLENKVVRYETFIKELSIKTEDVLKGL